MRAERGFTSYFNAFHTTFAFREFVILTVFVCRYLFRFSKMGGILSLLWELKWSYLLYHNPLTLKPICISNHDLLLVNCILISLVSSGSQPSFCAAVSVYNFHQQILSLYLYTKVFECLFEHRFSEILFTLFLFHQ